MSWSGGSPVTQETGIGRFTAGIVLSGAPLVDVQVEESIVVVVAEAGTEAKVEIGSFDRGAARHGLFHEGSPPVVDEEVITV